MPCWYDPLDPERVVLVRGYSWWIYLVATVPVIFIFVGAGGIIYTLLHWGKSAEHRAAITQRVQDRDLLGGNGRGENEYPNVPERQDITSSPGTKLRYRLPIETSPGWALIGTLLACLFWNGIVGTMVFFAVRSHLAGKPEWLLIVLLHSLRRHRAVSDLLVLPPIAGDDRHRADACWKSPIIPCIPAANIRFFFRRRAD